MDKDKAIRAAKLAAKQVRADSASENIADYVAELLRQGHASEVTDDLMAQADPQRLHHHYVSGNTGMDMPMDQVSRMARAAQMGFNTDPKYHGTYKNFSFFSKKNVKPNFGPAQAAIGHFFTNDPKYAAQYSAPPDESKPNNPQILPVFTKDLNVQTFGPKTIYDIEDKWSKKRAENFKNDLAANGSTGVSFKLSSNPDDKTTETAIFDPTHIRSQFARFDPRLSHLSHLSASTGGAMELARAITAKNRAGGQIAPSKYLPNVPRAVHADGGRENGSDGITAYHASPEDIVGQFRPSARDVGIHFAANPDLAHNAAVKSLMGRTDMAEKVSPKAFRINARPDQIVDIPAASNRFDFYDLLEHLHGAGKIDSDTFNKTYDGLQDIEDRISNPDETMKAQNVLFSKALSKSNIKALRYMNNFDAGPTWKDMEEGRMTSPVTPDHSYIVTDPSAIQHQDITKADGGRIGYGDGGKSLGLYSKAAQIIRNQPQAKGSVDQLLAMVSKAKGVKPAELANAGRPAGDTMSKEELAQHFEQALPKVDVERIGGRDSNAFPQYEQYTLPGGENYREHLLHLSDDREPLKALHRVMGAFPRDFDSEDGARQYIRQLDQLRRTPGMESIAESLTRYPAIYQREEGRSTDPNDFKSSHWATPNVLAHVRMDEHDNGKTLHVQEVQSDWGQEGRDKGFHDPENPYEVIHKKTKEVVSRHSDYDSMVRAYRAHPDSDNLTYGDVGDEKPPQGPYVGNTQQWTDLALKHILTEAAKNGNYDRVVFSPGEANADLYGQRKKANKVSYDPESNELTGYNEEEGNPFNNITFNRYVTGPEELQKHVGKDIAQQLVEKGSADVPNGQVGGHGMVDYYKNYVHPGALKLLQQHDPSIKPESYDLPEGYKGFSLPMTDTARQSILKNGFQAFQRGGEVHKATGGPVAGYVPMASLPTRRLINAPIQQQQPQGNVGTFSQSLNSLMDTVEGFKKKPEDAAPETAPTGSIPLPEKGYQASGMYAPFQSAIDRMIADAPGKISVTSGYRTPQRQEELWNEHAAQYPDPEVRDNYVARPGTSSHNYGLAADLSYADEAALKWAQENAARYGLNFRMGHEDWHIEPANIWELRNAMGPIQGYAEGGEVDNSNVKDLSTVRTMRDINSGDHSYGAQNVMSELADKYAKSQKAFDAAYADGAFGNFDMGDMFKYKGPLKHDPKKIVGFTMKHVSSWPSATKTYNDHYPALEWETQNADRKVDNVPVEWLEDNMHKYDKVGGKPKIVRATGGNVNKALALTRGFTKDGKSAITALKPKGK